jgi:hypothetical protein
LSIAHQVDSQNDSQHLPAFGRAQTRVGCTKSVLSRLCKPNARASHHFVFQ